MNLALGLAPKLVDQIAELITEINSQGVTVLLVEQNANMALNISEPWLHYGDRKYSYG
jgi:branched-chain amino acid transport system ATP-binding protein